MAGDEQLGIRITAKDAGASRAIKDVGKATKQLKDSATETKPALDLLEGAFTKLAAGFTLATIGKAAVELSLIGAQSERLGIAYDGLAAKAGQSGAAMLDAMRDASAGTISDMNLMLSANKAMMLGVADSADELGQLLEVARVRGKAMGLSSQQAFNDIVTGIGRMSPLILDNLGITVDLDRAYKNYAETLGKAVSDLTEAEQKQALLNDVLRDMKGVIPTDDDLDKIERLGATWANFKAELGKELAPDAAGVVVQITDAFGWLTDALDGYQLATNRADFGYFAGKLADTEAQIASLRMEMAATGDPTGELAGWLGILEQKAVDLGSSAATSRLRIYELGVSEEDAAMAAGGFGGALAAATPAVTAIGDEANTAAGKILGLVSAMATFATGPRGKATTLLDFQDYFSKGVKAGNEADLQHRLTVLKQLDEHYDFLYEQGQEAAEQNEKNTAKYAADWETAADKVQRALESAFAAVADKANRLLGEAIGASKKLGSLGVDIGAPGGNGAFEDIYRLQDIAINGTDRSPWDEVLGVDQETAKRIVSDFQRGMLTDEVQQFINKDALVAQIKDEQLAEQMQAAFAEQIAGMAGVDVATVMKDAGFGDSIVDGMDLSGLGPALTSAAQKAVADQKDGLAIAGGAFIDTMITGGLQNTSGGLWRGFIDGIVRQVIAAMPKTPPAGGVPPTEY